MQAKKGDQNDHLSDSDAITVVAGGVLIGWIRESKGHTRTLCAYFKGGLAWT